MNFDESINQHIALRFRLRQYAEGTGAPIDPFAIAQTNICVMGQWLYGEGKKYAANPEYQKLEKEHAHFHVWASEIVNKIRTGEREEAIRLLDNKGRYARSSALVIATVSKLRKDCECSTDIEQMIHFGWPEVDGQHDRLMEYFLLLELGIRELGHKSEVVRETFRNMKLFLLGHLNYEEELFRMQNYPGHAEHCRYHDIFREELILFETHFDEPECFVVTQMVSFLRNWTLHHMDTEDRKYVNYFRRVHDDQNEAG